ncbi:MAG: hemolysin family protein [Pirellulaceae bacterium]
MTSSEFPTWMVFGALLSLIGGFGAQVLGNFSGRSLETFCRLRGRRDRFGDILDWQDEAVAAAHYLSWFGNVLLIGLGFLWLGQIFHWFQEDQGKSAFQAQRFPIVVAVILGTWMLLFVPDWLPRVMFRAGATRFLYYTWPFWKLIARLFRPLTTLGDFFQWIGSRLSDQPLDEDFAEESLEDEIRTIVHAGEREGLVGSGIRDMIQGVMNLDEREVASIMTPRSDIDAIDIEQDPASILASVVESRRTRIPIYQGSLDNILGILFVKDLLGSISDSHPIDRDKLRKLLREAWRIPGNRLINELLRDFLHKRNHMAIVVDEYQQTVGVVTIEDALEEIVGEIADEADEEEANQILYDETHDWVEAEGRVAVAEINSKLGWNLPVGEDYTSIGGLLISRLGRIPEEGLEVMVDQVLVKVLAANHRQVRRMRLQHSPPDVGLAQA